MSLTSVVLLDCCRRQQLVFDWFLRVLEVQGAGFLEGGEAALEVDGVGEAGGFKLAQGLVGADAGVADYQEAFVRGNFGEAVF
jgi:hypothetical protein